VEGIFQSQEEVDKHAVQVKPTTPGGPGTAPGDLKFKDLNGDGVIDLNDRTFLGSFIPKFSYSLNLSANYKNFGLTLFFQGVQGNKIYNATRTATEGMVRFFNAGTQVLNAWTPTNQNTDIAELRDTRAGYVTNVDTRWVEDGSFIRGKNILLGYNFPTRITNKIKLNRLRVYASVQNFFLVTNYSGNDPEVTTYGNAFAQGQTFFDYPKPTIWMLGLNVAL